MRREDLEKIAECGSSMKVTALQVLKWIIGVMIQAGISQAANSPIEVWGPVLEFQNFSHVVKFRDKDFC